MKKLIALLIACFFMCGCDDKKTTAEAPPPEDSMVKLIWSSGGLCHTPEIVAVYEITIPNTSTKSYIATTCGGAIERIE